MLKRRAHLRFAYNEIPASSGHLRFQYTWCCGQTGPRPRVIPTHELYTAIEHLPGINADITNQILIYLYYLYIVVTYYKQVHACTINSNIKQ